MANSSIHRRGNPRYWISIILIAILGHLILLFLVKPSFFGMFKKSLDDTDAFSSAPSSSFPHAIIAIPVDVEGEESQPIEIVEPGQSPTETDDLDRQDRPDADSGDILNIVDQAQSPLPGVPSTSAAVIPPTPVELTWPGTADLQHCLGLRIAVRIRVGPEGEILRVEPVRDDLPADCTAAAVRAARLTVFLPGRINGNPAAMWTTIRLDFEEFRGRD